MSLVVPYPASVPGKLLHYVSRHYQASYGPTSRVRTKRAKVVCPGASGSSAPDQLLDCAKRCKHRPPVCARRPPILNRFAEAVDSPGATRDVDPRRVYGPPRKGGAWNSVCGAIENIAATGCIVARIVTQIRIQSRERNTAVAISSSSLTLARQMMIRGGRNGVSKCARQRMSQRGRKEGRDKEKEKEKDG
eukprot:1892798-Rhodomonas_salina.1